METLKTWCAHGFQGLCLVLLLVASAEAGYFPVSRKVRHQ